ncbi:MAG TPA: hypothetical protein VFG20_03265 [Planctomycetaceae bacterium]|nr:hypothetical protein [Planctomycetaceae bacterium]
MVALSTANHQYLQELESKLRRLKQHSIGQGPVKRFLEAKLRELEAERQLFGRRATTSYERNPNR